jgi:hypothetical protein
MDLQIEREEKRDKMSRADDSTQLRVHIRNN